MFALNTSSIAGLIPYVYLVNDVLNTSKFSLIDQVTPPLELSEQQRWTADQQAALHGPE